ISYRCFPPEWNVPVTRGFSDNIIGGIPPAPAAPASLANFDKEVPLDYAFAGGAQAISSPRPDLNQVTARKNLNESAFFFPQLTSDSNGVVRMTFTMPEALTKWRFMGFAHDTSVRGGY